MIERMLFGLLIVAAGTVLYATYNLTVVTADLTPRLAGILEAVAMIEESADSISANTAVLQCAELRGEWHPEAGCILEEIQ